MKNPRPADGQGETGAADRGREQLVLEHLPLAGRIAGHLHRHFGLAAPLEDVEAYARAGLVEAARRYDPGRGVPFHVFAQYRIQGALWDGVRQMGWAPRRRSEARFAECANAYLEEVAGERPRGAAQLARSLEERGGSLAVIFAAVQTGPGAPDDRPDDGEPGALRRLERAQLELGLSRVLQLLSGRERRLFEGLYREGRTLSELAAELGVSTPWASRLHRRTIEALRGQLRAGGLLS